MENPQVFYTYEWAVAVEKTYGGELKPLLFLAYEGDQLRGVASLATDPRLNVVFLAANTADYCDFLSSSADRPKFVAAVLSELRVMKLDQHIPGPLVLANLPQDSATVRALGDATRKSGFFMFARPAYLCAQVQVSLPSERDRIRQMIQQKKILRRREKELQRIAPVGVQHHHGTDGLESVLPEFAHAHVARFLATGRISNLVRPERRAFLTELAQQLATQGWWKMSCLMVGDQAVAWNYGFEYAGSWFWYQPTFDEDYQRYSPGRYLLWKMIEEACGLPGMHCLDLGLGAEEYKDKIANAGRQTLHVTLRPDFSGYARSALRYHLAEGVKSAPSLERWVRRTLRAVRQVGAKKREEGGMARSVVRRLKDRFLRRKEVCFYAWPYSEALSKSRADGGTVLVPLDWKTLAQAAIAHSHDGETMNYLLRSAQRLQSDQARGYALLDQEGVPVNFCWTAPFEGFFMAELSCRLSAPSRDAVLIFDGWTPRAQRGRGHLGNAISRLAVQLRGERKTPWAFVASSNTASRRGVEKCGFTYRFSLLRKGAIYFQSGIRKVEAPLDLPANAAAA